MSSSSATPEAAEAARWVSHLEAEESSLELLTFNASTAFTLGSLIRQDYLAEFYPTGEPLSSSSSSPSSPAAAQGQAPTGIVISIQTLEGQHLFSAQAGHPACTSADNWSWVARKIATVKRFGRSSFHVGRKRIAAGKHLDGGLDPLEYAAHGGAVPIYVTGVSTAPVAVAVVSGLKQEDDHRLVAEAIQKIAVLQRNQQRLLAQGKSLSLRTDVELPPVKKQLIVFDFDWSLADQDTDRWVHECLAPHLRKRMKSLKSKIQFTDLCAQMLRELHAEGATPDDIKEAMKIMPFHPGMIRGVKALKADPNISTTFFLLSNSNSVYIDTILTARGLQPPTGPQIFTEVVTNPARFLDNGLLEVKRRVPPPGEPGSRDHGCQVGCSANMCKGEELEAFLARHGGRAAFERVIYVGDGGNDYCPVLRLGEKDVAFVRRYRGLEKRIREEGGVSAGIRWWAGAWEMEGLLGELHGKKL